MLPSDNQLLSQFVSFAQSQGGLAPRWYYINISRDLILSVVKALIARDALGTSAYYEVMNDYDPVISRALDSFEIPEPAVAE